MHERILIAGSGGQGIVLCGKLLATAALKHFPHITFFPAYGAEVRGGTSHCQIILSGTEIASPVSAQFDSILALNQASATEFMPRLVGEGLAVVNSSLCKPPAAKRVVQVNATELADRLGDVRVANFIMLGAFLAASRIIPATDLENAIREAFGAGRQSLVELNVQALHAGMTS